MFEFITPALKEKKVQKVNPLVPGEAVGQDSVSLLINKWLVKLYSELVTIGFNYRWRIWTADFREIAWLLSITPVLFIAIHGYAQ